MILASEYGPIYSSTLFLHLDIVPCLLFTKTMKKDLASNGYDSTPNKVLCSWWRVSGGKESIDLSIGETTFRTIL
jgi:hypothetical protein